MKYEDCIKKAKQHERTVTVTSKIMQLHVVPPVVLFLHFRTLCSQHMQFSSVDEDQLAVKDGTCGKCGRSHDRGNCPAYGTKCFKCGSMNHFKQFCRTRHSSSSSKGQSPYPKKGKPQQYRDRRSSGNFKGKGKGPSGKGGGGGSTPHKKKQQFKDKRKAYMP